MRERERERERERGRKRERERDMFLQCYVYQLPLIHVKVSTRTVLFPYILYFVMMFCI